MSSGRIHRAPLLLAGLFTVVVGVGGGAGVYYASERRQAGVGQDDAAQQAIDAGIELDDSANDGPAENYLLVGTDTRENLNPEGGTDDPGCNCTDTIMILRRDPDNGAALVSLPRDLWVDIPGYGSDRINSAYAHENGSGVLIDTIHNELGIRIDHYAEIDFAGFVDIVDAIGGVEVCVEHLIEDPEYTAMRLDPGCHILSGLDALAFARARHVSEFIDGEWVEDQRADIGRIERQQSFVTSAVNGLLAELKNDPERAGELIEVAANALTISGGDDLTEIALALRAAAGEGLRTFSLPVDLRRDGATVDLGDGADEILDYFRGAGPLPPEPADTPPADSAPGEADG
ncbi:LCP family protein [Desertimonas flava]|uniref:LCP family protein n=1 Tax=Desertimonas flava TaxID=2064846 RepID=UPI000E343158|nr:LCP family protein [Desertimonas flava]